MFAHRRRSREGIPRRRSTAHSDCSRYRIEFRYIVDSRDRKRRSKIGCFSGGGRRSAGSDVWRLPSTAQLASFGSVTGAKSYGIRLTLSPFRRKQTIPTNVIVPNGRTKWGLLNAELARNGPRSYQKAGVGAHPGKHEGSTNTCGTKTE